MKKRLFIIITALALLIAAGFGSGIFGAENTPGSSGDPVVTQSYVKAQTDALKTENQALRTQVSDLTDLVDTLTGRLDSLSVQLDALKEASGSQTGQDGQTSGQSGQQGQTSGQTGQSGQQGQTEPQAQTIPDHFVVVEIKNGGVLQGKEGTEMILRAGSASAIASKDGGVTDLTAGADLKDGTKITKNHLLIIPRDDGRGIRCTGLCYVMVKGDYELKQ